MTTLATVIGKGAIGSRPAAASAGRLYFSTEPKTYRDNGSSWDDVSDAGTAGNLTGDVTSVGLATTIGAGKVTEAMQVLANNTTQNVSTAKHGYAPILPNNATKYLDGTGAYSTPAGGGGSTATSAALIDIYPQHATNGTSDAVTITAAASGSRIVVVVSSRGRDVTAPVCTNTTFTEMLGVNFSTTIYLSIYVGVVAGGSSGTTVTTSATGSNWIIQDVYVINDTLTPTAGNTYTNSNTSCAALAGLAVGPVTTSLGDFFVVGVTDDDGTTAIASLEMSSPVVHASFGGNNSLISGIGRASATRVTGRFTGGTSGSDAAVGIVVVS